MFRERKVVRTGQDQITTDSSFGNSEKMIARPRVSVRSGSFRRRKRACRTAHFEPKSNLTYNSICIQLWRHDASRARRDDQQVAVDRRATVVRLAKRKDMISVSNWTLRENSVFKALV